MLPVLSIIVPVYNAEEFLTPCLDSIVNQSYKSLEIILVNDGSTDKSKEICERFVTNDPRIVLINQENSGQASARNRGLELATGKYIAFVDSDDTVSLDLFKSNVELLERHNTFDIVQFPRHINFGSDTNELIKQDEQIVRKDVLFKSWLEKEIISWLVWDKIYRRDIFSNLRFKEGMIYEDNYLIADVLSISKGIRISNKGIYYYWLRENSTTTKKHSLKKDLDTQKVSLNILRKIKDLNNVSKGRTVIVSRVFYVYVSLIINYKHQFSIDKIFLEQFNRTSLKQFFTSGLPPSQIVKLIIVKILGLNSYFNYMKNR